MKSVLHVALIGPSGYSNKGLMDGFLQAGFSSYHCFDFQLESFTIGRDLMRRKLIHEADKIKPDMIFCQIQSSEILDSETWEALSHIAFTVNYTFDIRTKEQTKWLYDLAPHIGLLCFSNQEDVQECKRRGYNNCMVLQSSADPDVYKLDETKERKGVVFIGNNFLNTNMKFPLSEERAAMVEFLQKEFPDDFKVYGNNWNGSKMTSQKEEVEIYQSAAIVVNQNNFRNTSYTSDRIWRAMMCGVLCLTEYFEGAGRLFGIGHVDWWADLDSLKVQINHYLSNPEEAKQIGEAGRQHVLENHTWTARVKEMMAFIQDNLMDMRIWEFTIPGLVSACTKAGAHVIGGVIPEALDEKFDGKVCDCGKMKYVWTECGCVLKEWQLRAQQNI